MGKRVSFFRVNSPHFPAMRSRNLRKTDRPLLVPAKKCCKNPPPKKPTTSTTDFPSFYGPLNLMTIYAHTMHTREGNPRVTLWTGQERRSILSNAFFLIARGDLFWLTMGKGKRKGGRGGGDIASPYVRATEQVKNTIRQIKRKKSVLLCTFFILRTRISQLFFRKCRVLTIPAPSASPPPLLCIPPMPPVYS